MQQSQFRTAPLAKKQAHELHKFGQTRVDDYFWLHDKDNPEVIDYLHAENQYTQEVMAHTKDFQQQLYTELLGRIKEDDSSYPTFIDGYYYYSRTEKDKQYSIHCRKKASLDADEEIIFDVNKLAGTNSAFIFGGYTVSPQNNLAGYFYNTTGSYAEFTLKVKDLELDQDLDLVIEGASSLAWFNDNNTILYSQIDDTLRSDKVFKRKLTEAEASLIYQEQEPTFSVAVSKSKDKQYLVLSSGSFTSSETYLLSADDINDAPKLFIARQKDVEYSVYPHKQDFYVYYQDKQNVNGKLYAAPLISYQDKNTWREIIPHSEDIYLCGLSILEQYLLIEQKVQALNKIKVLDLDGKLQHEIIFPADVYLAALVGNPEMQAVTFRYSYSALNQPPTLYEYNIKTGATTKLKQLEIPSGFNVDDYQVERMWADAEDGVKVPLAVVYKKGIKLDGSAPALLYGYGSYGSNTEAGFRNYFYSLIDRGFVVAVAQIRGGSELGRQWYEDGKFLKKKNTFTDFIACAEKLIDAKYTSSNRLAIMGRSAGGLLVAAVANMRPDLFHTVVALVPFVDVVTTMLDNSLPLTVGEYEEWGNPNQEEYYNYMLSYAPYDNVKAQDYPNMLITGGINDSQVLFHEPAKWIAKLRALKTDSNMILLHMNMDSGHGGATGKYDSLKELSFELAFILTQVGIND